MAVFLTKRGRKTFPLPSSTTVGDVITWDNKEWIVVHYDTTNRLNYLMSKDIVSILEFGFGPDPTYSTSYLKDYAVSYENTEMSASALKVCKSITVSGVTAKVFVPTYEQMNGGFSYFTNTGVDEPDYHRIATYQGTNNSYYTSSTYGGVVMYVYGIDTYGAIRNTSIYANMGFRPCVCVQM